MSSPTGATYILAGNAGTTGIVGTMGNLTAEEKARDLEFEDLLQLKKVIPIKENKSRFNGINSG